MNDTIVGTCCSDCAIFIANNDDSGASEDWDIQSVNQTLDSYRVVLLDNFTDFSGYSCDVCLTDLAGSRYDVEFVPH